MGVIPSVQTVAVRHGRWPVNKSGHAKGRGHGDPALRVCDVDSRPGGISLSSGRYTTNSGSYSSLAQRRQGTDQRRGTHVTITAWSTIFSFIFSLISSFLLFFLLFPFGSFPLPDVACISLSFVLLRPCSSHLSLLSAHAFLLAAILTSLSHLNHVHSSFFTEIIFLFAGLACVVSSYSVRSHFTCFTHEYAIIVCFRSSRLTAVTTDLVCL